MGYRKIENTKNASPQQLLEDLKIRSAHYARKAKQIADRAIRIEHTLTIISFILSVAISVGLSLFQAGKLSSDTVIWLSIVGGGIISIFSLVNRFVYSPAVSAKVLYISQQFYEIKEEAKVLVALEQFNGMDKQELMSKYEKLLERYNGKRESFIEYVDSHQGYSSVQVGHVKVDEGIYISNIDDEDILH